MAFNIKETNHVSVLLLELYCLHLEKKLADLCETIDEITPLPQSSPFNLF